MPPKIKITKADIVDAAVEIVRSGGAQTLNARTVASVLNCSTQPVFSNFATMNELLLTVVGRAEAICNDFIEQEIASGRYPAYKASGMAYIRFAKEEKELFKLLYMRDRSRESEQTLTGIANEMENIVRSSTGLDEQSAKLFHLEMWVYVHGIATMFATGFLDLEWELVSKILTDSYQGLRKQYGME